VKRTGRVAWIFGDNFDVDLVIGLENITETDPHKLARLCMCRYDPKFPQEVRPGDILVAGRNFGYGHPHTQPLIALKTLGVDCIIAESFFPALLQERHSSRDDIDGE
jgi:3-isopropylmalate/(R)-2-methylmalate dehydratase small subunit